METDRNLLFGVIALQADLIDTRQFVNACALWTTRKQVSLADLLVEQGWILAVDKAHVEYLLERKLQRHGGDPRVSLASVDGEIKRSLAALGDADIHRSLASLQQPNDSGPEATVDFVPAAKERYSLVRLHASGGIGRVWLARDSYLGREVALKELRPERTGDPRLLARFLNEAEITGQLEHPGVVPVYELARRPEDGQPFYTMRFVKGWTLSDAIRDYHAKAAADNDDSLELVGLLNAYVAVCNTIAYAHSRGVLHRDVKGQNIVLGDFGEVVVLDWGLAKRTCVEGDERSSGAGVTSQSGESNVTMDGQLLGTPSYMAPEQAAGRLSEIGPHTDIYGLGAMLYELLTGRPPFGGADTRELIRMVIETEPPAPREIAPKVPVALETVCLRAMSKNPAHRYSSASEIGQEVQRWQEAQRRQAEEALRQSEALYHSLVETVPLCVWRKDREGRFTFGNARFCKLFGLPLTEILGKTDFDFFSRELAEDYQANDTVVLTTGKAFQTAEVTANAEGEELHIQVIKAPVFDMHGKVVGTQGIFWDVTEHRHLEEALSQATDELEKLRRR
jgi:eukaryotic-like serine/threonine-protein kinase